MIKVQNKERAIRIVEAWNALSVVLPLYDQEARAAFRAAFGLDMADMIPKFFMDLARHSLGEPEKYEMYVDYLQDLILYTNGEYDEIPKPENARDAQYLEVRVYAEKMVNSWNVKES